MMRSFDLVIPTTGRASLVTLLRSLAEQAGPLPDRVIVVDDRREGHDSRRARPLPVEAAGARLGPRLVVLSGDAAGPAAARNRGWRASTAEWVVFLDDDVVPAPDWLARLQDDLESAGEKIGGSQGNIEVPLPRHRRPTDWERNVSGLQSAQWATADMAYKRSALEEVAGFDERFRRAYREDSDLALRVMAAGYRLTKGRRATVHPVRSAGRWVSVALQAGNRDDALMRAIHGRAWRAAAGAPSGRRARHLAITASGALAVAGALSSNKRVAGLGAGGWVSGTAELAWARIAPGPRTFQEIATMLGTSAVLPAAATWHWVTGVMRYGVLHAPEAEP